MTRMVCHRGANRLAPENTFAAADLALSFGAEFIELDVRESADGVMYVHHDATLERTTNGTGPFAAQDAAALDRLDAGSWFGPDFTGQPIPRLDAYLEHLRGRACVYIELKICDPARLIGLVRDLGMAEETFYFSFNADLRAQLHAEAPDFKKMITLDIAGSIPAARQDHHAGILEISLKQMRQPGLMDEARAQGLEVMVYPASDQTPGVFTEILSTGADYVNLDTPDIFAQARNQTK